MGGGWARVMLPDGTTWPIGVKVAEDRKGAGWPHGFVYCSAVAIGPYGIAMGGSNEGVMVVTRRIAGEPTVSAAAIRGERKFRDSGLIMVHGMGGFGMYDIPLPWGVDPDIDAYLIQNGHTQGASNG